MHDCVVPSRISNDSSGDESHPRVTAPGEPVRALREDAYRRAVAFLRVHLNKTNEGDLEAWQKIRGGS